MKEKNADPIRSRAGRLSVLFTGLAALVFVPLYAVCRAADAAVRRF